MGLKDSRDKPKIILVTGPPLNGRDEYIQRALDEFPRDTKVEYIHVFDVMRDIAPNYGIGNLTRRNVLEIPEKARDRIRDGAFARILRGIQKTSSHIVIVSTPSQFHLRPSAAAPTGKIDGINTEILMDMDPDMIVAFVDELTKVKGNLYNDQVWRERVENKLLRLAEWRRDAIELVQRYADTQMAQGRRSKPEFIIFASGHVPRTFVDLCMGRKPRVYISYHITGMSDEEIDQVRRLQPRIQDKFVVIDPYAVKDWDIVAAYDEAISKAENTIEIEGMSFSLEEVEEAVDEIRNQIVIRDYLLIESCHATLVLHYNENPSYGVMGEVINTCNETPNYTYVLYPFKKRLSPFFEYYANTRGMIIQDEVRDEKDLVALLDKLLAAMEADYKSGRWPRLKPSD